MKGFALAIAEPANAKTGWYFATHIVGSRGVVPDDGTRALMESRFSCDSSSTLRHARSLCLLGGTL